MISVDKWCKCAFFKTNASKILKKSQVRKIENGISHIDNHLISPLKSVTVTFEARNRKQPKSVNDTITAQKITLKFKIFWNFFKRFTMTPREGSI